MEPIKNLLTRYKMVDNRKNQGYIEFGGCVAAGFFVCIFGRIKAMKKILVVVDMQNDFIDGALGTAEAAGIVDNVVRKIHSYPPDCIYATRDTHGKDYLATQEGKYLPVEHCIKGTKGWEIRKEVAQAMPEAVLVDKPVFGSEELVQKLREVSRKEEIEIELVGLCTDICVVTNALLMKTAMPETRVCVDASCCAGVTPESHAAALLTMKMCQVEIRKF